MGLEEHFGDAGGAAEVAVDWEGWAGIEHIGVGLFGAEEHGEVLVGVLGVLESRPEVQPPAAGRGDRDGMEKRDDVQQDKAFLLTGGGAGQRTTQPAIPAASRSDEPLLERLSASKASEYLDTCRDVAENRCFACHGSYAYLLAAPILTSRSLARRQTRSAMGRSIETLPVYQSLLQQLFWTPCAADSHSKGLWRGHRTFHIDGTSFSMSDTPGLQKQFGQPTEQQPGCGFPVAQWQEFRVGHVPAGL